MRAVLLPTMLAIVLLPSGKTLVNEVLFVVSLRVWVIVPVMAL